MLKQSFMRRLLMFVAAAWIIIYGSSCTNIRSMQYLKDTSDTPRISKVLIPVPQIQKGDLLGISVYSDDPLSTAAVTRQVTAVGTHISTDNSSGGWGTVGDGYLVNPQGLLQLYKLGTIRVEGLTPEQLADTLEHMYEKNDLLKNPYVEVRFLNYKITVIGEVNKPGQYTIPVDKVNAFEAVGLAGDITVYGRRDNLMVIREENGVRKFGHLNLKDPNVFLSPYYYLRQNDLVIVDVAKNKSVINNQNAMQALSIGASIISVLAVVYSIVNNN